MGAWIFGAVVVLLSLISLFVAAQAHGDMTYLVGLGIFILGVAVIFGMIMRVTGTPPRRGHGGGH
jgi:hypothetical protein